MIQIKCPQDANSLVIGNKFYLDLYDKIKPATVYRPLVVLTNQTTKYSKTVKVSMDSTNKERYLEMQIVSTRGLTPENLSSGIVFFGSTDFPLGFYDVTIYKNTSNENMDITGLSVIYSCLANIIGNTDATAPVTYTEYATNDSDTESIYLTNPL
jgi:hypothetical protein|tara:strand:- start:174 stop:638 length:465 start_codon:yes stop_codon:yes gene_type:complete